jgi:hypothetical protein
MTKVKEDTKVKGDIKIKEDTKAKEETNEVEDMEDNKIPTTKEVNIKADTPVVTHRREATTAVEAVTTTLTMMISKEQQDMPMNMLAALETPICLAVC